MVGENTKIGILTGAEFLVASGIGLVVAGASIMPKWNNPYILFYGGAFIMLSGVALKELFTGK